MVGEKREEGRAARTELHALSEGRGQRSENRERSDLRPSISDRRLQTRQTSPPMTVAASQINITLSVRENPLRTNRWERWLVSPT